MPQQPIELAGLQTEDRNPHSARIDRVSTQELCQILNQEDSKVPRAVEACLPVIAEVIDVVSERVRNGGRLFYIGAGTSGRLGVLDASEIPPTYSAPSDQFIALIAGGDHALRHAKEGAEDSDSGAEDDLKAFKLDPEIDTLIGIASSGRTPYVLGGLAYAKALGCTTVGVVCVEPSAVAEDGKVDYLVSAVTGPEVVTGSTRMKAGTATKLVLNMMSTGIMIKLGKTYGNLMIDLKATNLKLMQRAKNIIRFVAGSSCTKTGEELEQVLEACHGSVKLAAVTVTLDVSVTEAEERLQRNKGVLARVFEEARQQAPNGVQKRKVVLCVDAGGTNCTAVIIGEDGKPSTGHGGPCNISNGGIEAAVSSISKAVQEAVDGCPELHHQPFQSVKYACVRIGIAGYDRPSLRPLIDKALSELFNAPLGPSFSVITDINLLPASMISRQEIKSVVVLVAGTGSIAMSYSKRDDEFHRTNRVGGWGYLLGDDGAGYAIGREAIRRALYSSDLYRLQKESQSKKTTPFPPLSQAVLEHFQKMYPACQPEDLLSTVLVPDPTLHQLKDATLATTKRVAGVAKVVMSLAGSDDEAKAIVETGTESVARLAKMLIDTQDMDRSSTALMLSGGLMQNDLYRRQILEFLDKSCGSFARVEVVASPALSCALQLHEQEKLNVYE